MKRGSVSLSAVKHQVGFTLIEIMVVVVIIGLMVALLTINLSKDLDRLAGLEAERFQLIVDEVRDEAIISGDSFLLYIEPKNRSYYFDAARQGRINTNDGGLLDRRVLQEGLNVDWDVLEYVDDESTTDKVLISPLGEITPFNARFIGEEREYRVFINDDNQLEQEVGDAK